jgi:hypothetical protein
MYVLTSSKRMFPELNSREAALPLNIENNNTATLIHENYMHLTAVLHFWGGILEAVLHLHFSMSPSAGAVTRGTRFKFRLNFWVFQCSHCNNAPTLHSLIIEQACHIIT